MTIKIFYENPLKNNLSKKIFIHTIKNLILKHFFLKNNNNN